MCCIQGIERHLSTMKQIHLFRNCRRDKFMTTFRSVANLDEGNSVTKPCEAGLRTDTSGVLLQKKPKQSWELHHKACREADLVIFSVSLADEAIRGQKGYSGITLRDRTQKRLFQPIRTEDLGQTMDHSADRYILTASRACSWHSLNTVWFPLDQGEP